MIYVVAFLVGSLLGTAEYFHSRRQIMRGNYDGDID
jgi:uncharacterized protein YneF (UPF0154 family)